MSVRLGELLTKASLISQDQLKEALRVQKETGGKLGETLIKLGFVSEEDITECLSQQFGVPSINLQHFEIDASVIKLIPGDVARKYNILPVNKTGATITIAMADPTNVFAMDDIKFMTGYNVEPVVASELGIKAAIDNYYGTTSSLELKKVMEDLQQAETADLEVLEDEEELDVSALADSAEEAPVVKLCNLILTDAIKRGASDIHIEPYEKEYRVRFRMDGILYEIMNPPLKLKDAMTSRMKILAKLDISEKRLPQDGRIKLKIKLEDKNKELDFRVSVLPTLFGEKIVMRLLDKDNLMLDMRKLGFEAESLARFEEAIFKPWGMVLVTGPTGSGKTNTLYSALSKVNSPEVNIMTAEDPVEFNLPGINQVQMKESIGLNFAATLRSFLRQDPNIILVGEIRDFETAEIAIKAALTGHLVLSTLHTVDDQPPHEHGHRAVPRGHGHAAHRRPASRAPHLRQLQGDGGHDPAGDREPRLQEGRGRNVHHLQGPRLRQVQQHRLQRPRRPHRSHGHRRRHPRPDPLRRHRHRHQAESHRERHDHAPPVRLG
jgi:type IV pilus assembly protein PilB